MEFTSFSGRKRTLASNTARKAEFDEIPIISLASPEEELIAKLHDACTRVGFMYIKASARCSEGSHPLRGCLTPAQDHGVPQEKIEGVFRTARAFFDQPDDVKNEINFRKSSILRGYEPSAQVRTDETKKPDLNEAFNCGYEPALDPMASDTSEMTQEDNPMAGPNAWPSDPAFKAGVAAYYSEILSLARRFVRLLAKVLELPADYFDPVVTHPGAMLRLLKYPAQDPAQPDALGIGAHTDIECFTILCQGTQPALQILNVNGEWIEAPPIPGTFVINIGDMLARWSNDVFISTVHRVLNITGEERYSVPFFFGVNYDATVEPLPTCAPADGKAAYEPVLAGDYVYRRLAKSRLGKDQLQATSTMAAPAVA